MVPVIASSADLDILCVFLDVAFLLENTAVFQSQVGDQLAALSRQGYSVGLLAVIDDRAAFDRVIGDSLSNSGVEIFAVRNASFFVSLLRMSMALRALTGRRRVRRAYVRGLWGPIVIALAGRRGSLPYVYDVRGDLFDELTALRVRSYKRRLYTFLERWCIRGAARVSAVTRALAGAVEAANGLDEVTVVPCCVNSSAMSADAAAAADRRTALGFAPGEVVLVYSGGLSHYQQVPAMLALWRALAHDPDVRFLLLTNDDPHRTTVAIGDLDDLAPRLVRLSLPRSAIPATLAAADIGFMLRDSRSLNRVASPVKFPEYLCAGLSVVGSPGTGDASSLIELHRVGVLVDPADMGPAVAEIRALVAARRRDTEGFRERARCLARSHYDWAAYAPVFARLYGSAARDARLGAAASPA